MWVKFSNHDNMPQRQNSVNWWTQVSDSQGHELYFQAVLGRFYMRLEFVFEKNDIEGFHVNWSIECLEISF